MTKEPELDIDAIEERYRKLIEGSADFPVNDGPWRITTPTWAETERNKRILEVLRDVPLLLKEVKHLRDIIKPSTVTHLPNFTSIEDMRAEKSGPGFHIEYRDGVLHVWGENKQTLYLYNDVVSCGDPDNPPSGTLTNEGVGPDE